MDNYLSHLGLAFASSAIAAFLLTPPVRRMARAAGVIDLPGDRHAHLEPTPRLGGIAVFCGLSVGMLAYFRVFGDPDASMRVLNEHYLPVVCSGLVIVALGMADDVWKLSPITKVLSQGVAAAILMNAGYIIDAVWTPWGAIDIGVAGFPLTLLWFIAITNAFNLIDGIDGLLATVGVASLAGIAAVALSIPEWGTAFLPVALAGALLGFLPWNWHRARIFLGDSGSMLVGFAVAGLSLRVARYWDGGVAVHVMLALCALPALDTVVSMARRYVSGTPIFAGDRGHIHHLLVSKKKFSVPKTVIMLGLVQLGFSGMAVVSRQRLEWMALVPIGLLLALVVLGLKWLDYLEWRVVWRLLRHYAFVHERNVLADRVALARLGEKLLLSESLDEVREGLVDAMRRARFRSIELVFPTGASWRCSNDEAEGAGCRLTVTFEFDLGLGKLVCSKYCDDPCRAPSAGDVATYLAEPLGRALARIGGGGRIHENAVGGSPVPGSL